MVYGLVSLFACLCMALVCAAQLAQIAAVLRPARAAPVRPWEFAPLLAAAG